MRTFLTVLCISAAVPSAHALGQDPSDPVALKPVNGRISDSLGAFGSVRELADGRVLFSNDHGGLWVANLDSGKLAKLHGVGTGLRASIVYGIADDTTLVAWSGSWTVLHNTDLVRELPPHDPALTVPGSTRGFDTLGSILKAGHSEPGEFAPLVRVSRTGGATEVIASLLRGPVGYLTDIQENATIARDGWIAVLRAYPWRVDWRRPDGVWVRGAPLPIKATVLNDEEKELIESRERSFHAPGYHRPDSEYPAVREPFSTGGPMLTSPDGKVLILRTPTADNPGNTYLIIDRTGTLTGAVEINPGDKIVGFGRASVYVRQARGYGWPGHLERHEWP